MSDAARFTIGAAGLAAYYWGAFVTPRVPTWVRVVVCVAGAIAFTGALFIPLMTP